jgi:two-component system chemotaxis sensor kinase CheA
MNLAGELVLGRNQLLQTIATGDRHGLESVSARLDQVTSKLQEAVMQTRMQPIGSVFGKFPRVVRDLSGKLGKQCDLVLEGKDVELDKSIIEAIGDPLTHLVRNSVDHGIETPADRVAAGKRATGTITLQAAHQAGKVNISISDDGAGINPDKLKRKAVEKGLITEGQARDLSEHEALNLIFHPGFSTAERVTDVSGRGVGMDVVKTNIQKAGGTVEIQTKVGAGTTINIKLPLTLAIVPSLIVRCGEERYAIPQVSISELVRVKATEIARRLERVSGAEVLRLRGSLLPLVRLSTTMQVQSRYVDPASGGLADNQRETIADRRAGASPLGDLQPDTRGGGDRRGDTAPGALNIIVVETGHLRYGLIVDGLHDSEEIVVKPLGSQLKGTPCLAGATVLGDGKVALILDVAGIAAHQQLKAPVDKKAETSVREGDGPTAELQTVLLFTNDPGEQFAVPMGLISRLERIQAAQIDSVGGQAVLQYRGSSLPLMALEEHIRARPRGGQATVYVIVFKVGHKEVGLIAPNLVDIRDIDSRVDVVTFREPGVLGSTVVQDKATRVVDLVELVRLAHPTWLAEEISRNAKQTSRRVLLAEDSDFFRKQVADLLATEGYDVLACEDGEAGWRALDEAEPPVDLVVTDIEMPNLDGYGLTRRIREDARFASLPVIAVTSLAGQEDIERGRQAGVSEYQIKLDRDRLADSIRRFLRSAASPAGAAEGRRA